MKNNWFSRIFEDLFEKVFAVVATIILLAAAYALVKYIIFN